MLDHALAYAAGGLPVLPVHWPTPAGCSCRRADCASVAKHPLSGHGVDDATTDTDQIARWWERWPLANVAVRPLPGLAVLDVDPRNGGASALAALTRDHGALPRTWTAATGGGGLHIWVGYGGPLRVALVPGVDLKSVKGYLLVEPSVHASGRVYRWLNAEPVAPAPGWLRRLLDPPKRPALPPAARAAAPGTSKAVDGLVRAVAGAANGNRNRALHWAACRAAERGADPDLLAALVAAAVTAGLPEREARATVASATGAGVTR